MRNTKVYININKYAVDVSPPNKYLLIFRDIFSLSVLVDTSVVSCSIPHSVSNKDEMILDLRH